MSFSKTAPGEKDARAFIENYIKTGLSKGWCCLT